jgi:hypothetical protein
MLNLQGILSEFLETQVQNSPPLPNVHSPLEVSNESHTSGKLPGFHST